MDRSEDMSEAQQQWTEPRELRRSRPREVSLTKTGMALSVLAMALLMGAVAAGVALGSKATHQRADRRLLDAQGIRGDAVITRLWRSSDKDQATMAAYEFRYQGAVYRHSTRAPRKVWAALSVGSPVVIRFVPEHPENNTPADWGSDKPMPAFVVFLVPALLVFFCGLLMWAVRKQKSLLSEGKAVMGIVRKTHRSDHGQAVTFEYTLPGGQVMRRRSGPTHKKLQTGSIVTVLYDPEKPTRTALYPMDLVRIDDLS